MPGGSRSKSHKQCKDCSTEYSDIDDDVKMKETNDVEKNGEKRKTPENGNVSDEFAVPTKRRRETIYGGSDRWHGDEGEVVNIDDDKKIHNEPIKEEMRNIELEKELERRMKRRGGYSYKDIKYKDKVYRYSEKDSKHKGDTNRKLDVYNEDGNRDYKHKEERNRDVVEQDHRHKTGRARDDKDRKKRSRDHTSEFEYKNLKGGSHRHPNSHGGRSIYDGRDRVTRHKDDKDLRRDYNKSKDQHLESKKYRTEAVYEERGRHNFNSNRDTFGKVCIDDLPAEKRMKSDSQLSPSSINKISSHLPPQPPFKAGSDGLLGFGSSEEDRGKLNNPKCKSVDPNLGRTQTNWNNFPNWPYVPFQHVPPPMFNPFTYQSVPPMLGGPPTNMNHAAMPYHFTGDGFGKWDHGGTESNDQSLESNVVGVDLEFAVQKNEDSVHGHTDELWSGQTCPPIKNEENSLDYNNLEVMKVTQSFHDSMVEKDDDTLFSRIYLSKIDVSKDLTRPELYDQCKSMLLDLDQASSVSDECDCKILFLEEGVEDDISNSPSLFAAVDDSVFKKAMSLYTKQKVHFTARDARSVEDQEKENIYVDHSVESQETENIEVDLPVKNQEKENINVDHPVKNQETENIEVDHPVENQETESCAPSVGDCELKVKVKVNYDGSKEVDSPSDGGSLLVLTNLSTRDLIEFGSVNLTRIHSPE